MTLDRRTVAELREDVIGEGTCIATPFGIRRVTYADHIASGRSLASVEKAIRSSILPLYANTHTEDSATGATTTRVAHEAAQYIKRCLGADQTYKLLFPGTGATGALKRLQEILGVSCPAHLRERMLAQLSPTERLVVFVGPYEHHSNELTWRESLAEVITVPLDADGLIDLVALERALKDPRFEGRQKLGTFSAASNVTGLLTDVRAIAALLHAHGASAVFDFAAAAPYVAIDVGSSAPGVNDWLDAVVLSPHKFIGGPGSAGLLLFHESLYHLRTPTTAGGGTVSYVSHTKHRYIEDIEVREDAGTPGIIQKVRTALAFRIKERLGVDLIEQREHELATLALERLARIDGIKVLGNLDAPRLAVASFLVSSGGHQLHPKFVVRLLSDLFGIQARAGCSCAGPYGHDLLEIDDDLSACYLSAVEAGYDGVKPGWARVSFHYLIDEDEFEYLLAAIEFLAQNGQLLLPLYDFDWHTGAWQHRDELASHDDGSADARSVGFDPESWQAVGRSHTPRGQDYASYLQEARSLATELRARAAAASPPLDADDPAPAGLDPRLLRFAR